MKVALIVHKYNAGGSIDQQTQGIAENLGLGHRALVITYGEPGKVENINGVEVHHLKGHTFRTYPSLFKYSVVPPNTQVWKILRGFGPDVVHVQVPFGIGAAGERYATKNNLPLVTTCHIDIEGMFSEVVNQGRIQTNSAMGKILGSETGRRVLNRFLDTLVYSRFYSFYRKADIVTSPSGAVMDMLQEHGVEDENIRKIPNFIETRPRAIPARRFRRKWGIDNSDFMVLHVGRLCWEKRIQKILETADRMREAKFVIASKGPQGEELQAMADKMKLDNVIFTGHIPYPELYGAYKACNAFMAAGPYDTFNISAAQSLAFGKPLVGINRMGLTEFIEPGMNGFLVDWDGHEVANYTKCLGQLMDSPRLQRQMGRESKKKARKYTKKRVARQFMKVYEEALPHGLRWRGGYAMSVMFGLAKLLRA